MTKTPKKQRVVNSASSVHSMTKIGIPKRTAERLSIREAVFIIQFLARIGFEFLKENQEALDDGDSEKVKQLLKLK